MTRPNWKNTAENKFLTYKNLLSVYTKESYDPFCLLPNKGAGVVGKYQKLPDMKKIFPLIPVRKTVASKLNRANKELQKIYPDYQIMVAYGYRSLKIQQKYFNSEIRKYISKKKTSNKFSTFDYEQIHRIVAVPQVAGHPTGGAIDAILYNKKDYVSLPFGSNIYDFEPKYAYFNSPYIKEEFKKNRILLRSLLIKQGFAPYDGEWWHFSYGDPEWAFYYKKKYAIFCQVSPEKVKISLKINKTPPHDD